jgi:hypothetical protein
VREGKLESAMQDESAMRTINWVIGLPDQLLKEAAKSGDNT